MTVADLVAEAERAGAKTHLEGRDALEWMVEVVWHGTSEDWIAKKWPLKLNQIWLNDAREALAQTPEDDAR